jgi:tight adherence protein B
MTLVLPFLVGLLTFAGVAVAVERRSAAVAARRVSAYMTPRNVKQPRPEEQVLLGASERRFAVSERYLARAPLWSRLESLVERADLPLRTIELFWAVAAALGLLALGALALGTSVAIVAALLGLSLVALRVWLGVRVERRRRAFEEQLPELLTSVGSALRAGHGFSQALQAVAADAAEPAASEFGRVLAETRLGRPLEDALADLGARIDSRDLRFVLDAIVVQRQVGGSLAGIFEIVADSVRSRQQFALKLRSLTAMGRTSATVLIALPVILALALSALDHGYLSPLGQTPPGRLLLGLSVALMAFGWVWLRRVVAGKAVTR